MRRRPASKRRSRGSFAKKMSKASKRRPGGEAVRELGDAVVQLRARVQLVREPDAQRFLRVDDVAGVEQLESAAEADDARQQERAAAVGHESALDEDLAERRPLADDAEVAGEREIAAEADGWAVDGGKRIRAGHASSLEYRNNSDQLFHLQLLG